MNCQDICRLFCCPPFPSRIAAKLAFLPPEPTYSIIQHTDQTGSNSIRDSKHQSDCTLVLSDQSGLLDSEREKLVVFRGTTSRRQNIACLYVHINENTKTTVLLSHGNAVDLGLMAGFMLGLGSKLNVNIMSYDYSGYGMSTGKPSEVNIYADAECALQELMTRFKVPLEQIVLYGQSIGTAPTVELATRHRAGLIILHSPLLSGIEVACPGTKLFACCDVFKNREKVVNVMSPTLVIHGTEDEVIDYSHGQEIYDILPHPLDPLFIAGAGHNDCEMYPQYLDRLKQVITPDLTSLKAQVRISAATNNSTSSTNVVNGNSSSSPNHKSAS